MTVRANPAMLMALVVCAAVFFVHEAAALDDQVFSVLQFNVWNFDSSVENGGLSWKPDRVKMIADMVKGLEPPPAAIAWNEIRRHTRNVASDTEPTKQVTDDMLADLAELLPEYADHTYYVLGEDYGTTQEGVGLFSRYPVNAFESIKLDLGGRADSNHRVCVRAELDIPGHSNLNVFVTHFSFDRSQQLSNVKDVKKFVMRHATPQILMGDLNVYLDYDAPMRELMRADDGSVLFRDAWLESHPHPIDQSATAEEKAKQLGYTFSSWDPHNRADRILVRGPGIQVAKAAVIGRAASKSTAASDHMALFSTFKLRRSVPVTEEPAHAENIAREDERVAPPQIRGAIGQKAVPINEEDGPRRIAARSSNSTQVVILIVMLAVVWALYHICFRMTPASRQKLMHVATRWFGKKDRTSPRARR